MVSILLPSLAQLGGVLVEGMETSLHGSGQLDYEVLQCNDIIPKPSPPSESPLVAVTQSSESPLVAVTQSSESPLVAVTQSSESPLVAVTQSSESPLVAVAQSETTPMEEDNAQSTTPPDTEVTQFQTAVVPPKAEEFTQRDATAEMEALQNVTQRDATAEMEALQNDMASVQSMSRHYMSAAGPSGCRDVVVMDTSRAPKEEEEPIASDTAPLHATGSIVTPSHSHSHYTAGTTVTPSQSYTHIVQDAVEWEPNTKSPSPPPQQHNPSHHSSHPHSSHYHSSHPHSAHTHVQTSADAFASDTSQDDTGAHHHTLSTPTLTPSHHPSPTPSPSQQQNTNSNPSPLQSETESPITMATTTTNTVAMETKPQEVVSVDLQTAQSASNPVVVMATEEASIQWFSLTPRAPCETKPTVTVAAVQNGIGGPGSQYQLVATTPGGQQILAPQQQILQSPGGAMQYYLTPSGALAVAPAPPAQQVQMGYALVGNTLVPQQYLTAAAPQQQYIVTQGGIQYMVGGVGGLMGLGGLGGVAMVPQGGIQQQGLVQAIGEGGAGMLGATTATAAIAIRDGMEGVNVKTVAIDDGRNATTLVQVATDEALTNHITEKEQEIIGQSQPLKLHQTIHQSPSPHRRTVAMDTTAVAMDTADTGIAMETGREATLMPTSTPVRALPQEVDGLRGEQCVRERDCFDLFVGVCDTPL